jgi:hypothetical protein
MPWDKERYPHDWDERAKARKEQAGWTCEACGAKQGESRPLHLEEKWCNLRMSQKERGCH